LGWSFYPFGIGRDLVELFGYYLLVNVLV